VNEEKQTFSEHLNGAPKRKPANTVLALRGFDFSL
jgi:hypothetical protein